MTTRGDEHEDRNEAATADLERNGCVTKSTTEGSRVVPFRRAPAFVYCVVSDQTFHVKIGVAADPEERVASLQTAHHEEVVLVGYLRSARPHELECQLHQRFSATHVRGEWFAWSDDLEHFIRHEIESDWDALRESVKAGRRFDAKRRKREFDAARVSQP